MSDNSSVLLGRKSLEALQYATPYFLLSRKKLVENYQNFERLFPGPAVADSQVSPYTADILHRQQATQVRRNMAVQREPLP